VVDEQDGGRHVDAIARKFHHRDRNRPLFGA
jgi:hypothetical protein